MERLEHANIYRIYTSDLYGEFEEELMYCDLFCGM